MQFDKYEVTSPDNDFYALIEIKRETGYGFQFVVSITAEPTFNSKYFMTLSEAVSNAFRLVGELAIQSD